jgi:protein-S-isoprenylcysteine O-methyltransferase
MVGFNSSSSPLYGVTFAISLGCWLLFEIWVFTRDRRKEKGDYGGNGRWVGIALAVGITLALNMPGFAPGFDIQTHFAIYFILGILLIWTGLLGRFWAVRTLGTFFSTRLLIQERHVLIQTGPYKHLRNPSYTAALMILVGIGLGIGNWLSVALLMVTALATYMWRIKVEEKMLMEAFGGAYTEYKKKTWALIPFVW